MGVLGHGCVSYKNVEQKHGVWMQYVCAGVIPDSTTPSAKIGDGFFCSAHFRLCAS